MPGTSTPTNSRNIIHYHRDCQKSPFHNTRNKYRVPNINALFKNVNPLFNNKEWCRDFAAIRNLKETKVGVAYYEKWINEKDPQKIIEVILPYVKALLELGVELNPRHTGELQLGYYIDSLTKKHVGD